MTAKGRGLFTPRGAQKEHGRKSSIDAAIARDSKAERGAPAVKRNAAAEEQPSPQAQALRTTRTDTDKRVLVRAYGAGVIRCKAGQSAGSFYTSL